MQNRKYELIKAILAIAVTILIFIILFNKINFLEVKVALVSINIKLFILASFISIFVNLFLGADKWRRILKNLGYFISYKEALFIMVTSNPIKFILPFKSGEITKALYLNRLKSFKFEKAFSSIMFDKFLNLLGTVILLAIGTFFFRINLSLRIFVYLFIIISIAAVLDFKHLRLYILNWIRKINLKIYNSIRQLISTIEEIKLKKKIGLGIYSIFFQTSELLNAYILFKAFDIDIPISAIFLFIPLVILIGNIPITISGLGTREAAVVVLLLNYSSSAKLLSFALILSFVEYILPALVGLIFLKDFVGRLLNKIPLTSGNLMEHS